MLATVQRSTATVSETCVLLAQDVLNAVKAHKDGYKIIREYETSQTVLQNKELLVRIAVNHLIDVNGGSLYVFYMFIIVLNKWSK